MFQPSPREKADPQLPDPSLSETRIPDTGGIKGCSREGRLNLPSIPEDYSGSRRRTEPGNAVWGRHASIHPCILSLVLARAVHTLSWREQCSNGTGGKDSLARVLNSQPATNEGDPPRAPQREDRQAKEGALMWASSPLMTPREPACKAWRELPTPRESRLPYQGGWSLDPTEREEWEGKLGSAHWDRWSSSSKLPEV